MRKKVAVALIIFSIAGLGMMSYLTKLHYSAGEGSACDLSETVSCSVVNISEYSEVFGIPVAIMGVLYFLFVLVMALKLWRAPNADPAKIVGLTTIVMLIPSAYLTWTEIFLIGSICLFCELSKVMMILILISCFALLKKEGVKVGRNVILGMVVLGLLGAAVAIIAHNVEFGVTEDYSAFAQCLDEKGYLMYGSATCASCLQQRKMFGDAFQYIEEIECDARNSTPEHPAEVERCVAKGIKKTPTWFQEDAEGNTLYQFEAGIVSFERLSEVSGCEILPSSTDGAEQ